MAAPPGVQSTAPSAQGVHVLLAGLRYPELHSLHLVASPAEE